MAAFSGGLDAYFDRALKAEVDGEHALALKFYERAAGEFPNNGEVYEKMGMLFADIGESAKAMACFEKSVAVAPEESGAAYMCLGQMKGGEEAKVNFLKGVALFRRDAAAAARNSEQAQLLRVQLASAHCAVAELFMSDLCFSPEAEASCEHHLVEAEKADPSSITVAQTFASLRISQARIEDAKVYLQRVVEALGSIEYEQDLPPFESRVVAARLLIDVGSEDVAVQLLDHLLKENDEIAEVWILLAMCHVRRSGMREARDCAKRARKILAHLVTVMPDCEQFASQRSRLDVIEKQVKELLDTKKSKVAA